MQMRQWGLLLLVIRSVAAQTSSSPCYVNSDGMVNVSDVQMVVNQALGLSVCTADLTHDGTCNVIDLQRIITAALGGSCNVGTSPPPPTGSSITITAPSANAVISGTYTFAVNATNAPTVASVEYYLGSLRLGVVTSPPFSLSWNTGYGADGDYSVRAIAYDAIGTILATAETLATIRNHGGSLTVTSPDLSKPLSGKVPISVAGADPDGYFPARWNFFLDGNQQFVWWTDQNTQPSITISPVLDTTTVLNGKHELHVLVASKYWTSGQQGPMSWHDYRIGLNRLITVDNGHALMAVSANYEHVYLSPGQSLTLTCTQLFTDNTSGSCTAPAYSSSDTSVVSVNASGTLTAGANEGFATVTLSDSTKTSEIYVWVRNNLNVPHFSGNGQLLTSYKAGSSIFPVAPFMLQPSHVRTYPAINDEAKRAGINTLYSGFYQNPRSTTASYATWQSNYDAGSGATWTWVANNGYHLYTMGDEITRGIGGEAWWTLNWPSGQQAVQHAMQSLANSGVAIAADIIDEGSMMWGGTPTPPRKIGEPAMFTAVTCNGSVCTVTWPNNPVTPSRFYAGTQFALTGSVNANLNTPLGQMFTATNITANGFDFVPAGSVTGVFTASNDPNLEFLWWAGSAGGCPTAPCNPPVPNTALSTIADWLRTATSHVPISWPALGADPPIVHDYWAGKDSKVSDFASHYWDSLQPGRTYSWSSGVFERTYWMRNTFYSRQKYARLDRPQIMLDSVASYFYTKQTPGAGFYHPPQDSLIVPGTSPNAVVAGIMTAVAIGNAGVRLYYFEDPGYESTRVNAQLGSQFQTGASPIGGDENANRIWNAMGFTANVLTKTLQPFILGTSLSSPALGTNIVTAARQSSNGKMLLAVNGNDWDRTLSIDLTSYRTGNTIAKYIVGSTGIKTTLIPDANSDTVSLKSGETVIYLIPSSSSTSFLTTIPVAAPALPAGATKGFLHNAYIYSQGLEDQTNGVDCTSGCSLAADTALGDIFYKFVFTDSTGRVVGESGVTTIAGAANGSPLNGAVVTATGGTPQSAMIGASFASVLQVSVKDANNNPLSGLAVTFTAPGSGASGSFGASTTVQVVTDSNGLATAPTFTANTTAGGYTVTAAAAGIAVPASFSLTNYSVPPAGGSLVGSADSATTLANLTTEGSTDWVHWGDTSLNRKAGVTARLSSYTVIGNANVANYNNDLRPMSWTDGTPVASSVNNKNGVLTSGVGNGFWFTAPADTATRTITVHVGGWNSAGILTAHLSDGSAPDFADATTAVAGQYDRNYTLTYKAATAGQILTVTWKTLSGAGNVNVNAAALR